MLLVQIELNWLLDDAVAACRLSEAHDWQPATWRQLESGRLLPQPPHDAPDASADGSVALRADIASLRLLWQQRLRDRSVIGAILQYSKLSLQLVDMLVTFLHTA